MATPDDTNSDSDPAPADASAPSADAARTASAPGQLTTAVRGAAAGGWRGIQTRLQETTTWVVGAVLAVIMTFMVAVRIQTADRFLNDGTVLLSGNDAWYHLRMVEYTVANWPATMPFDPFTRYPIGTHVGQFGTLYDQLLATAALILGLGSPSDELIRQVLLYAPPVFGALAVIPTYIVAKRLSDSWLGGLLAAAILALLPGIFLQRGLVGAADHNIAEPFFQTFAVAGWLAAFYVAEREKPVWELVAARDWAALRRPTAWSLLAGLGMLLYLWMWPPGLLLVGIFAVFITLSLTAEYLRGNSPDHYAFVAVTSLATVFVGLALTLDVTEFSVTKLSLLHLLAVGGTAVWAAGLAALARWWESSETAPAPIGYPVTVGAVLALGAGVLAVGFPSIWHLLVNNVMRTIGFGAGDTTRTIAEAQPFLEQASPAAGYTNLDVIMQSYGLTFVSAAVGLLVLAWRWLTGHRMRAAALFTIVWTVVITAAAFTQVRFNYYLAVPVAIMSAVGLVELARFLSLDTVREVSDVHVYQVLTIGAVLAIVAVPLVVSMPLAQDGQVSTQPVWTQGTQQTPGDITHWDDSLTFLAEETPAEGQFAAPNATAMDPDGTYERPADGDYAYPDGTYGVMSWWDYGHWITQVSDRIPVANPFQESAKQAASFLLAQSEADADQAAGQARTPADGTPTGSAADPHGTRYVMVDWKMVDETQKFGAPTVFHENSTAADYFQYLLTTQDQQYQYAFTEYTQQYYESMMVRLYRYHGSAMTPEPFVVESQPLRGNPQYAELPANESGVQTFNSTAAARAYAERNPDANVGGVGPYPREKVDALNHYRLVNQTVETAFADRSYLSSTQRTMMQTGIGRLNLAPPAWVKTFERVPGATIEGTAPANTTVRASVDLDIPGENQSFTYTQYADVSTDGEFTMTVPYSTTDYENWGPENGYTNTSVHATGPYEFTTVGGTAAAPTTNASVSASATAHVPEGTVVQHDTDAISVALTNSTTNTTAVSPVAATGAS